MAGYDFTLEQFEAAKAAKSPEELVAKAKEQGYDITLERAAAFLNPPTESTEIGEISDEELDNVAGGHGGMCHNNGREVVTLLSKCCHGLVDTYINYIVTPAGNKFISSPRTITSVISCGTVGDKYMNRNNGHCMYLLYEKGLRLCGYPQHLKK